MPRKQRERIDAEAARELLNLSKPEAAEIEGEKDAAIFAAIQMAIIKSPHSKELAELQKQILMHPEDTRAHQRRDALLTAIAEEAMKQIQEQEADPSFHAWWKPTKDPW